MENIHERLAAMGIKIPDILLPAPGTDLKKWAVIACDQFTQDSNYWEELKAQTQNAPSALNLIFPEAYLGSSDETGRNNRKKAIHAAMDSYLENNVFAEPMHSAVYLERSTPWHERRQGIVVAIDLETYDWLPHARPLVRATEGTVHERLPPRMDIRRGAALETTHVLVLIDDEEGKLIPGIAEHAKKAPPLYDTPLMMNSGAVTGWAVNSEAALNILADGLKDLEHKANGRYGVNDEIPFLFAVGDGNHSLACAKAVWEEYKAVHTGEDEIENNAHRYALVEVENLHDSGIAFEPIHRIIFGADHEKVLAALSKSSAFSVQTEKQQGNPVNVFRIIPHNADIAAVHVEPLLERFIKEQGPDVSIDYIHGEDEVLRLVNDGKDRKAAGILLPPIDKNGLFKTIANNGPLPRKSFSMGEGYEKRFYLECRRLTP